MKIIKGTILTAILLLSILSCSKGDDPVTPQPTFNYTLLRERQQCELDRFLKESLYGYSIDEAVCDTLAKIVSKLFPSAKNNKVWIYDYEYPSTNLKGENIKLSARAYIPAEAFDNDSVNCVELATHHLIFKDEFRPSNCCVIEAYKAWAGWVVIVPDMIGFGSSSQEDQLLTNGDFNAKGCIEGLKAGLMLLDDLKIAFNKDSIYNLGYSQGGLTALANLGYVSKHPECGINFRKTFVGAGPYDPALTFSEYNEGNFPDGEVFKIAGLVSVVAELGDKINPEEVFKEPLLSNYKELYLSKKYDVAELRKKVSEMGLDTCVLSGIIYKSTTAGSLINKTALTQRAYCGWTMSGDASLYMYGVEDDDYIPYTNYVTSKYFLQQTQPFSNMYFKSEKTLGHMLGYAGFTIWTEENW